MYFYETLRFKIDNSDFKLDTIRITYQTVKTSAIKQM